jgi:RNA polymerase sigma-70 factor (ECF subfamily)
MAHAPHEGRPDLCELLLRAQAGDEDARDDLARRLLVGVAQAVRSHLGAALRRDFPAEDVVQQVFVTLLTSLRTLEIRGEPELRSWLRHLVVNEIRELARSRSARKRGPPPSDGEIDDGDGSGDGSVDGVASPRDGVVDAASDGDLLRRVHEAMQHLSEADAELIRLTQLDGHGIGEAAKRLGLPESTARLRFRNAVVRVARLVSRRARGP